MMEELWGGPLSLVLVLSGWAVGRSACGAKDARIRSLKDANTELMDGLEKFENLLADEIEQLSGHTSNGEPGVYERCAVGCPVRYPCDSALTHDALLEILSGTTPQRTRRE